MCGITGLINCGDDAILGKMTAIISHRGPDDHGVVWFQEHSSGLGHNRLSIIDLSRAGHQPMSSASGDLWITYNGELYNFQEIKKELADKGYKFASKTDTEVILYAFEEWGTECVNKFNGMFAFAIYDKARHTLFAARDHIGIKPLYYSTRGSGLIFASEIKAILSSGLVEKLPDYDALHTPTRFQISPYTGFKGIYKLPPGHFMIFEQGQLHIKRYWDVNATESIGLRTGQKEADELDRLLADSVRLQMVGDVPVGILLSGGLDSSIIAALMRQHTNQDIHSFTIKFASHDKKFERMPDDSDYARVVAQKFGFIHHEIILDPNVNDLLPLLTYHLDEPLADPASINTYLISKAARELGVTVLLNGMGGDEIFGGYRKYIACLMADIYESRVPGFVKYPLKTFLDKIPVATSRRGFRTIRWARRFFSFSSLPQAERFMMSDLSLSSAQYGEMFLSNRDYYSSYYYKAQRDRLSDSSLSYLTRMCLNDTKVLLPEHNLTYSDKASMTASLESRPPLTDHRIVEFMFSLPPNFRIKGRVQKYLLKKTAERYLPKKIVYRPKAPFGAPLRAWIRGPLSGTVDDLLSEESIKRRGLYNPKYVRQLVSNDRAGKEDNAHILWTLLTNELWFRTFFD